VSGVVALIYLVFYRFPSTLRVVLILSSFVTLLLLLAIAAFLYFEEDRVYDLLYEDDFYDVKMEGGERDVHVRIYQYLAYVVVGVAFLVTLSSILMIPKIGQSS
jgi:hypothetical protein